LPSRKILIGCASSGAVLLAGWFIVASGNRLSALDGLITQTQAFADKTANRRREGNESDTATAAAIKTQLEALASDLAVLRKAVSDPNALDVSTQLTSVERQIGLLLERVSSLLEDARPSEENLPELHTKADAEAFVGKLGKTPSAEQLAAALTVFDSWSITPDEEAVFDEYKLTLLPRLRELVKEEVLVYQQKSLAAETGSEAAEMHAEAGRILSLYPIVQNKGVLDEAKRLCALQADLATRIVAIRRQRYNRWATDRIEGAINGYNEKKSLWSPIRENPALIASLVKNLGEVDPSLIEPAVLDLYSYAIDTTKGSISEADKIELAKRLTDPRVKRKSLGDF
jgi:KaiC/GvpD/RAD55 family RecA-like ATPase